MCGSRTAWRPGGLFACIDGVVLTFERADDRLWLSWGGSVSVAWHPKASAGYP